MEHDELKVMELFHGIVLSRGGVFFTLFTLECMDVWLGYSLWEDCLDELTGQG
jgi:hypothetical protein